METKEIKLSLKGCLYKNIFMMLTVASFMPSKIWNHQNVFKQMNRCENMCQEWDAIQWEREMS